MRKKSYIAPRHLIGGVALTNGLLLHAPDAAVMAIRDGAGEIHTKHWDVPQLKPAHHFLQLPGIRGLWLLWRTILWNSRVRAFAHEVAQELVATEEKLSTLKKNLSIVPSSMFPTFGLLAALLAYAEVVLAINTINQVMSGDIAMARSTGIAFVGTLVLLYLIVRKSGIWDYMAYHGAEHQAIHAYEEGKRTYMAVEHAWPFQSRCGAAVVSYVGILLVLIGLVIPTINLWWSVPLALALFSFSYEAILVLDHYSHTAIGTLLSMPGVLLQFVVVRRPSKHHSEVATKALFELTHYSKALKEHSNKAYEMTLT